MLALTFPSPSSAIAHKFYTDMAYTPITPRTDRKYAPTTPQTATPGAHRATGGPVTQPSPHYTTTRRHSLYGTEDRIVIDPGSRVWKVGFSGEGKPRDVLHAGGGDRDTLWTLDRAPRLAEREEEEKLLEARVQERLRSVFHEYVEQCTVKSDHALIVLELAVDGSQIPKDPPR